MLPSLINIYSVVWQEIRFYTVTSEFCIFTGMINTWEAHIYKAHSNVCLVESSWHWGRTRFGSLLVWVCHTLSLLYVWNQEIDIDLKKGYLALSNQNWISTLLNEYNKLNTDSPAWVLYPSIAFHETDLAPQIWRRSNAPQLGKDVKRFLGSLFKTTMKVKVTQWCLTLCDPMDYTVPPWELSKYAKVQGLIARPIETWSLEVGSGHQ